MKNTKLNSVRVATALVLALSSSQALSTTTFATHKSTSRHHSYTPSACKPSDVDIKSRNNDLSQVVVALKSSAARQGVTCDVSLNSYKTDGPTWRTSGTQALIDHKTVTLTKTATTAELTVQTAPCYGQNDLYVGSTRFDGVDGELPKYPHGVFPTSLITAWNGGKACVAVTPPAVSFDDVCGTDRDTYTIPVTKGVEYQVNGKTVAAGTYNGTGTVTVTATAKAGYTLAAGNYTWTFNFQSDACPAPLVTTPGTHTPATTTTTTPDTPHILAASTTVPATLPATGSSSHQLLVLASAIAAFAYGGAHFVRARFAFVRTRE